MGQRHWVLVFITIVALLVTACGAGAPSASPAQKSSPPSAASPAPSASSAKPAASQAPAPTQAPYAPLTYAGADRIQRLAAEAKKEGKLTWYTTMAGESVTAFSEGFKKEYGITVEVYRADENKVITRAAQEDQAGRHTADVFESLVTSVLEMRDLKILEPFYSQAAKNLSKEMVIPATGDLVWGVGDHLTNIGFGYNKNLVPANAVPKKLEDLLNPALKGKLAIPSSTTGVRWIGLVLNVMGDAKGREFLSKLSAQDVRVEAISGAALMDLIGQGQVAASPAVFLDHAKQNQDRGAPVEWMALDNTAITNIAMVSIGKKAPNPNAAALFAEFFFLPGGIKILEEKGYELAGAKRPFQSWSPSAGVNTGADYQKRYDTWQELFDKTFKK